MRSQALTVAIRWGQTGSYCRGERHGRDVHWCCAGLLRHCPDCRASTPGESFCDPHVMPQLWHKYFHGKSCRKHLRSLLPEHRCLVCLVRQRARLCRSPDAVKVLYSLNSNVNPSVVIEPRLTRRLGIVRGVFEPPIAEEKPKRPVCTFCKTDL